jgi:hypothetical protein
MMRASSFYGLNQFRSLSKKLDAQAPEHHPVPQYNLASRYYPALKSNIPAKKR